MKKPVRSITLLARSYPPIAMIIIWWLGGIIGIFFQKPMEDYIFMFSFAAGLIYVLYVVDDRQIEDRERTNITNVRFLSGVEEYSIKYFTSGPVKAWKYLLFCKLLGRQHYCLWKGAVDTYSQYSVFLKKKDAFVYKLNGYLETKDREKAEEFLAKLDRKWKLP